jgi:hypothetical protein
VRSKAAYWSQGTVLCDSGVQHNRCFTLLCFHSACSWVLQVAWLSPSQDSSMLYIWFDLAAATACRHSGTDLAWKQCTHLSAARLLALQARWPAGPFGHWGTLRCWLPPPSSACEHTGPFTQLYSRHATL